MAFNRYFATAAVGTEDLVATELKSLGAKSVHRDRGGVHFAGDFALALRANLWLRVAMRVLEPLAEFPAEDADALYEGTRLLPWPDRLTPKHSLAVEASVRDSTVTHSQYAALRVKDAIVDLMRERCGARPSVDKKDPDVRVVLRLLRNRATLSLDLSGGALFQRGYRRHSVTTPLKETLAAAVVLASGWDGGVPFCDPMCGSGTIPIEAALIGSNAAPSVRRRFGVERWPTFSDLDRKLLAQLRQEAHSGERRLPAPVHGSDRSKEAVETARANARSAGVSIDWSVGDAREMRALSPPGTVAFNPPYGERIGPGNKTLKTLYWQLGKRMGTFQGHTIAVLSGHSSFEGAFGIRPSSRRSLFNGPIPCELLVYRLAARAAATL
jgi:23S rRNA (guanine2445-N2)-methyltransferase / 23S rRNA (guanine2069-N7)-methyltransferase